MTTTGTEEAGGLRRRPIAVFIPLLVFFGLAALFLVRLGAGDASRIPSALIGHPAPVTNLPALEGVERDGKLIPGLDTETFKGAATLLNVWASWCIPCVDEVPLLVRLSRDPRFKVVGINYKDTPENARRFLTRYGNPFAATGADASGRASVEWGVYGVPETFVIGRDARIAYKLIGPITGDNLEQTLKPELEKALGAPSPAS